MEFSSFIFLSFFLPVVLVLHTCAADIRVKNVLLIAASFLFYAYGEPVYILLLLFSVLLNYGFGRLVGKTRRKLWLAAAVCINLSLLLVFKYAGFFAETLNGLLPEAIQLPVPELRLPIGISFYTFQALSYVIDVYRQKAEAQKRISKLFLYLSFFPQLIAGPIIRYHDVAAQIDSRSADFEQIKQGMYRFICGLGKKILISNAMGYVADTVFALQNQEIGFFSAWIGAAAYMMQIYFDFSGYSDMAIGLGTMFGFHFQENFHYPYIACSIQDFWRRWHISLTGWFREYLYIPLGGNRGGKWKTARNRYLVFLATGFWHGANWTFILWGMFHGTLLTAEQFKIIPVEQCRKSRHFLPKILAHLYTILAVLLGFVLFRADNLAQAGSFFMAMAGFGSAGGIGYITAVKLLAPYYLFIFALALIGATPFPKWLWLKLYRPGPKRIRTELPAMACSIVVLLLCLMALASDSYNPFIYFRF